MNKIILSALMLATAATASAQVLINADGKMHIGDFSYVGVGEYGGYDSDILGLYGSSGIIYSYNANKLTDSTRGQVFYWKPSPNYSAPFVFNVDLKVNGVAIASDMRLKEDVEEIEDASASLADITPVTYRLAERGATEQTSKASAISEGDAEVCEALKPDNRKRYGFVAQEVKKVFPDLVMEDEEGYLSVDYIGFIPLLVDAVKELQAKVDDQT